jgi:hypothetical protein
MTVKVESGIGNLESEIWNRESGNRAIGESFKGKRVGIVVVADSRLPD